MKYIINDDVVLSRPPEAPLAGQIAAFAKWARDQGCARQSRYRRVLLAAGFSPKFFLGFVDFPDVTH